MDLFQAMAAGGWLAQLAIASGALLLAAATALLARRWWRRDPALGYSLCVALLIGSLALLPVQWTVKGIGHALLAPWRAWWAEKSTPPVEEKRPRSPLEDGAMLVEAPMGAADAAREAARRGAEPLPNRRKSRSPDAYLASSIEGREALDGPGWDVPATTKPFEGSGDRAAQTSPPSSRRAAGELLAAGLSKVQRAYAAVPKREALLALWLAGGAWLLLARLRRLVRTMVLVRRAEAPTDRSLVALWRELIAAEPAASRVALRVSSAVASPACFGWLRPVLLVPADPAPRLSLDALRWALRHELVHVARGDALVATLQAAATTLFWFHPAAWWLSSEVSRLRELSCDRSVVLRCGRRRSYAHALLEHAAILNGHLTAIDAEPHSAGVRDALLHWGRSPSQIERRIEMLTLESNGSPRSRRLGGRLLACSLFALPLLAQVGGAATLLPGDDPKPAAAPVAPVAPVATAAPGAPALPVAQSAPAVLPPPAAPRAVSTRGEGDGIAPAAPVLPPRSRARVKRPGSAAAATAPLALPPTELSPVAAPLPPPMPSSPALPPADAAECCTQDDPKASCTAGAACAEPAVRGELAKLGYVLEGEDLEELEELAELEGLADLADLADEFDDLDEEFADLAIDLQAEFADFEAEFADLATEMAELDLAFAADAADWSEAVAECEEACEEESQDERMAEVSVQMDQARAEVERALAQAAVDVERELSNADGQIAAAMKALDSAEGLDDADRAKVKAALEKRMVEARKGAKRALDQSRAKADRIAVEKQLAQRRAQGFTKDDRASQQLQEKLARMAEAQDEIAAAKHAEARKQDEAKFAEARKRAVAVKAMTERKAALDGADAAAAAAKERSAARKVRARGAAPDAARSDEATLADRQKEIRMQIEMLQRELMRLQDQLAEIESASEPAAPVREDPPPPSRPAKRGRSMR